MSVMPRWFAQLVWSRPWSVAALNQQREAIPDQPGCYVFTEHCGSLMPDDVLYVGKAKRLRSRVGGYLVDYRKTRATKHKGRAFIFERRHQAGDHATFVRWTLYGGKTGELEANLCLFLWPSCTDRWETEHELWDDDERLNADLLG